MKKNNNTLNEATISPSVTSSLLSKPLFKTLGGDQVGPQSPPPSLYPSLLLGLCGLVQAALAAQEAGELRGLGGVRVPASGVALSEGCHGRVRYGPPYLHRALERLPQLQRNGVRSDSLPW